MKNKIKRALFLLIIFLMIPSFSKAEIFFADGKWSTTFNYGPCTQRGYGEGPDCATIDGLYSPDGIQWSWGGNGIDGHYTQTTSEANNPIGGGGNGFRAWILSNPEGVDAQEPSGPVGVYFPSPQKELWIRWYQRFQQGYNWQWIHYDKWLYIRTHSSIDVIVGLYPGFSAVAQGTPSAYQVSSDWGWEDIMGGQYGDGRFHLYEVHVKMDTNGANGVGQLWVDGVLREENKTVNWSNNDSESQKGWIYYDFENNQRYTDQLNGPIGLNYAYIDYDDMTVYNVIPPNRDAAGNPFIGPIGFSGGGDADSPSAPTGLRVE